MPTRGLTSVLFVERLFHGWTVLKCTKKVTPVWKFTCALSAGRVSEEPENWRVTTESTAEKNPTSARSATRVSAHHALDRNMSDSTVQRGQSEQFAVTLQRWAEKEASLSVLINLVLVYLNTDRIKVSLLIPVFSARTTAHICCIMMHLKDNGRMDVYKSSHCLYCCSIYLSAHPLLRPAATPVSTN